jgi:hypothetical protein
VWERVTVRVRGRVRRVAGSDEGRAGRNSLSRISPSYPEKIVYDNNKLYQMHCTEHVNKNKYRNPLFLTIFINLEK